ncbi:LacI family DNA-binding transcriptional regulator [Pseudochryseolinea flava]|uniref:Transcriptional regulator n=1 Tax=Pseudochryseolinea flava TaxID=2059302 RepID=A0A364Y0M5_9BACT|nr:substrate-binding domain-containing protein [Pseudochryseolinea flava]RAV99822.1 transcriptional regulator [Pseudochryseolinea flava]
MALKNIRIKDIAKLAGVSVGTVDRVLHNRGRVSDEALKKVTSVMEQIDYKPNLIARTLGTNKNYHIAALLPDPNSDPYWSQANTGIIASQLEWEQYGIRIEPFLFDLFDKESFQRLAKKVYEANPDAILVAPIFYHEALPIFELFNESGIPYVLFNTNIPEARPLTFIGQNLYQSGRVGAELMHIGQHHSGTLAVLHIDEDIHESVHLLEKERGFRAYFKEKSKIDFNIVDFTLNVKDPTFSDRLKTLLDDPTLKGIFVSTSKGTAVAASFLAQFGKREIRMVGYDMLDENLKYLRQGTIDFLINQNPKRQASLGISHLVNYLMFKKGAPDTDLFPLEVITQQNIDSYTGSGIH